MALRAPVAVVAGGDGTKPIPAFVVAKMIVEHHQPAGIAKRQGPQKHSTHNGEQRCGCADTERHHEHRYDRETRRAPQRAHAIFKVAQQSLEPVPGPHGPRLLTYHSRVSESAHGGKTGLFRGQPELLLFLFFQFKVRLEFSRQVLIPILPRPPSHISSPRPQATSREPPRPPSASTAILRPQAASCLYPSTGST